MSTRVPPASVARFDSGFDAICGLSLVLIQMLVSILASRFFFPGFSLTTKPNISNFQFNLEWGI